MATPRFVGSTSSFLPVATGQVIGYIRDPKEFAVTKWVQNIQAPAPVFQYAKLDQDQPVRMVDEAQHTWEDGADRPQNNSNHTSFEWVETRVFRRNYGYTLGLQAVETARKLGAFDPEIIEAKSTASQAMTNRANRIITLCETSGNWGSNTATATVLNGGAGQWSLASADPTSPNYLAIRKSLLEAMKRINLGTNGKVKPKDLRLVLSPGAALKLSTTSEMADYVKSQAGSQKIMEDTLGNVNDQWGLPARYQGVEIIVEDAVKVNIYPYAAATKASTALSQRLYCKSDDTAFLVSQAGGIDGSFGAPSFSTVQCYFYEYEMAVESRTDSWNKKVEGAVVEQFQEVLAAAPAGFLITDILA